ncbi:MAG: alpha/beta hydrolase-fold protein [Phycisphaerae bacterium]
MQQISLKQTFTAWLVLSVFSVAHAKTFTAVNETSTPVTSGRLVLYLLPADERGDPADGPFLFRKQMICGWDVSKFRPGRTVSLPNNATCSFQSMTEMSPGRYKARAVVDHVRGDSRWDREPGNLFSDIFVFEVKGTSEDSGVGRDADRVGIRFVHTVKQPEAVTLTGVSWVSLKSDRLTAFHGRDVDLHAAVLMPVDHESRSRLPVIFVVPAFGSNHRAGVRGIMRELERTASVLGQRAAFVVLDPEGPHGHHLFADSDNNGPVGSALVHELIPLLEERFPLTTSSEGRFVRGHSSGGWSAIWLALTYPEVFGGGCWASAPDPVTFEAFQRVNVYDDANMYRGMGRSEDWPSVETSGKVFLTIREENQLENAIGPRNTSAQQWDSWIAAFGRRGADGHPADFFDSQTGEIMRSEVASLRRFDIVAKLRAQPGVCSWIFKDRIRIIVGTADNFSLDGAVRILQQALTDVVAQPVPSLSAKRRHGGFVPGYIRFIDGANHFNVRRKDGGLARLHQEILASLPRSSN